MTDKQALGRRAKTGLQTRSNAEVRSKTLRNLIYLNSCVMDEMLDGDKSPLYKELLRRAEAEVEPENARRMKEGYPKIMKATYERPSDLIIEYLNSDDIMKLLGCNRRTAFDYLLALRQIHVWHGFTGATGVIAGRV